MVTVGVLARLEAKPGKEADVQSFLEGALPLAQGEPATIAWFAIRLGPSQFGIFDAFPDDAGRQAHLAGRVAAALMAQVSPGRAESKNNAGEGPAALGRHLEQLMEAAPGKTAGLREEQGAGEGPGGCSPDSWRRPNG